MERPNPVEQERHPLVRAFAVAVLLISMLLSTVGRESAASSPVGSIHPRMQTSAALNVTMRGCPEGVVPQNVNPASICTTPLDAPGAATASWSGGGVSIAPANRNWDGTYLLTVPANVSISLLGLEPSVRDDFHSVGADGVDGNGDPHVILAPGETRHIGIYYYYYVPGTSSIDTSQSADTSMSSDVEDTTPGTSTIRIATANPLGYPAHGICYELVGFAEPSCADLELVVFENVPPGTYIVRQTGNTGENYIPEFTVDVPEGEHDIQAGELMITPLGSPSRLGRTGIVESIPYDHSTWPRNTDNVSFVFVDSSTGEQVISTGCVQIVGVTDVGCDTQRGQIDFIDIPAGPHQIAVTQLPEGYVLSPGMENLKLENFGGTPNGPFHVMYFIDVDPALSAGTPVASDDGGASASGNGETGTVSIQTSIAGWPFTEACFELVGQTEVVCSEFAADMVYLATFTNIPYGTYTVRQTAELGEGNSLYVPDFTIEVTGGDQTFQTNVVISHGSPSRSGVAHFSDLDIEPVTDSVGPEASHISVVFIDVETREKVPSNACVEISIAMSVGCDNQRGQIDFLAVPGGNHEVTVTSLPTGYALAPGMEHLPLVIPVRGSAAEPYHLMYFIDVQTAPGE